MGGRATTMDTPLEDKLLQITYVQCMSVENIGIKQDSLCDFIWARHLFTF